MIMNNLNNENLILKFILVFTLIFFILPAKVDAQSTCQEGKEQFHQQALEGPIPIPVHDPETWLWPSVLEQYDFYTPIGARAIMAFKKAYEVTGEELYLEKTTALADAQTYAQQYGAGIYPIYQRNLEKKVRIPKEFLINCATVTSFALLELDEISKK